MGRPLKYLQQLGKTFITPLYQLEQKCSDFKQNLSKNGIRVLDINLGKI
jgi:hypothetical protein